MGVLARRVASAVTAAVLLVPFPALAAPRRPEAPPPPGLGIRLVDAPTEGAKDPRARIYVVDQVAPGARFARRIEVSNGDREAMDVLVYPAAARVEKGSFAVSDRGVPGEIPQWVTIAPTTLHLEPGARAIATASFAVPSDAPSGEVYGGLVAERPAPRGGPGVGVSIRAAIRVYLSVGAGGEPASDFRIDTLAGARDATGRPMVIARVHNTGGRALDLSGSLRLTGGPAGLSAGPFPAKVGTTLGLGQTEPVTVLLDRALPAGPWTATLELRSGRLTRRATATITFPAAPGAVAPPVTATPLPPYKDRGVVEPVAIVLLAIVALLVLLAFAWLLLLRRRRRVDSPA